MSENVRTPRRRVGWILPKLLVALVVFVGSAIVIYDGLTRAPLVWSSPDPLTYDPNAIAWIFAGVMLPLALIYGASVRAPLAESVFLWFTVCTVTYTKDFAYLRWPDAPFFVTDAVLAFELAVLFLWFCLRRFKLRCWVPTLLQFAFVSTGAVLLVVGLAAGRSHLLVLRDFGIVVYSFFFLVALYVFQNWESVRRLVLWFGLGAGFATLNALTWFLHDPEQRRYIPNGAYVLLAFIAAGVFTLSRQIRLRTGLLLCGLYGVGVLLYNSRSVYVALIITVGLGVLTAGFVHGQPFLSRARILAGLAVILLGLALPLDYLERPSQFLSRSYEELVAGTVGYASDPMAQFRLQAWGQALERFVENPVFGEGYGVPFTFYGQTDPRPHNTFLTVLYKMGLAGFAPFLLFLGYFFRATWHSTSSRQSANREHIFLYSLFLMQAATCAMGVFTLVLESPFTAALFWAAMGVAFRLEVLSRNPNVCQRKPLVLSSPSHMAARTVRV